MINYLKKRSNGLTNSGIRTKPSAIYPKAKDCDAKFSTPAKSSTPAQTTILAKTKNKKRKTYALFANKTPLKNAGNALKFGIVVGSARKKIGLSTKLPVTN